MNCKSKVLLLTAAVLLCTAGLSACGNDDTAENTPTSEETTVVTTTTDEAEDTDETTAATSETKKTDEETTSNADSTTTAAVTTAAPAETNAAAETAAANHNETDQTPQNDQQQNEQPSAPAANDTPAQNDNSNQTPQTAAPEQNTTPPAASDQYLFDALHIDAECSAYIASHSGYQFEEAISCIGDGKDRTYTYSNYKLITYFENGTETLKEINITGAGIATRKGISVGSSAADVERAYGAANALGVYSYQTEDGTLEFMMNGDSVSTIALYVL